MGKWTIYNLSGQSKAEVHNIEYEGNDGGARRVTVSVSSPIPIKWEVTDNISYRGEIFTLRHLPQEKKQARSGTHGEAFVYSDVVFYSAIDELASCDFLDVVKEDNNIHYSALPVFNFYCETIYDIADRLQANLDRIYTGAKKWTVEVSTDITAKIDIKPQALSFSKEKCSKVLERIVNELGVSYEYTNRTITFGAKPITMAYWFKYGKGEGLKSIEQSGADDNELVTRARVYGSTRNLPNRYYNKLYKNKYTGAVKYFKTSEDYPDDFETAWRPLISETMYVPNLMLPMFRGNGQDAYIDNEEAIAKYGLREGSVFFDGSGDDEEVYPTIENMTAERLAQSGIVVDLSDGDNGNLDELAMVEEITHSGVLPDNGQLDAKDSYFSVWLKDIGFDINDYLSTETAQISFNTGALAGRTFDIVKVEEIKLLFKQYKLTLKKVIDDTIQLAFPNTSYQPSVGDKFVLLGIEMPEVYILAAEQLLLEKGTEWSELNGKPNYTFTPEINDVEMLRKPHIAEQLKEGRTLLFSDEDLGIEKAVRISSLRISEEDGSAPKYEVTLSDKVSASLADRVTQSVVESLGTNSVSVSNINSLVQAYGNEHYLSKTKRDTAKQVIRFSLGAEYGEYIKGNQGANIDSEGKAEVESVTSRTSVKGETIQGGWIGTPDFAQGALLGTGGAMYQLNGATYAEFDYLTARKGATFAELIIQEYRSIGGALVISQANGEIEDIYKWSNGNGYDIYLKDWNANNQFKVNDLVRCEYWDRTTNQLTSYWVRVIGIHEDVHVINFQVNDFAKGIEPKIGDKLVQMGNTTDTSRQGCILLTTENSMPRMAILDDINSTTLSNANYKAIYGSLDGFTDPTTNKTLSGYGMWGENVYLHGDLVVSSTKTTISSELANLNNALTSTKALIDEEIREINNRLDGVVTNWFGDDVPRLDNHPADQWTTEQEKMNHIGDTYTNTEITGDNAGRSWRWVQENGEYKWILIADSDAIKALELASRAQSTADGKRRVFTDTPYTPYDKGDLWVKQEGEKATLYYSIADKKDNYSESDWLIGATDDTAIKDLQIGGTNLLNDTNKGVSGWFLGTSLDRASSYFITDSYYNGANGVRFEKMVSDVAQWETFTFPLKPEKIKRGKTYHFSFDLMADGGLGNIYSLGFALVEGGGNNALTPTIIIDNILDDGAWKHYDLEFVANVNGNVNGKQVVYFFNRELSKQWTSFSFANLKLEEGNKATTWSPSPEDAESALILLKTETTAEIEKLDDRITQSVTETKEYVDGTKEELDSKITTEVGKISQSVEETITDVNGVKTNLSRTGIDIEKKKIVVTANDFTIKNNNGNITASADESGNWSTNTLMTLNEDGTKAITINEANNRMLKHYYPYTNQVQLEEGWNGTSLYRYYDENGVMLWQIGGAKGFMDADRIEWTAVGLYDTKLDIDIESVEGRLKQFTSIGDVKLGTYYQHNVLGAPAKMYETKSTNNPLNGWFTNQVSWQPFDSYPEGFEVRIWKRIFIHYTNGIEDFRKSLKWDTDANEVTIV